jgi:hypothetical protein
MAPTAPPRFDAPVESPEELAEHTPTRPPAEVDDPVPPSGDVEIVARVERRPDGRPGWNTATLLDALVEMHHPTTGEAAGGRPPAGGRGSARKKMENP